MRHRSGRRWRTARRREAAAGDAGSQDLATPGLPACRCRPQDSPTPTSAGLSRDRECGRSPGSGGGSPFAGSSTMTTVSALPRGRAVGEATTWPQAGFGHAHADATGGASRCPLTARLPAGQLRRLSQGPHSRGDRRLLPREPGLIAGTRAPVSPARRTRWCGSARNLLAGSATTEGTSRASLQRADRNAVPRHDIDPGKPRQNAFTESFYGRLRDEPPNEELFDLPDDARRKRALRRSGDTAVRPHTGRRSQRRALGQFDGAAPRRLPETTGPTTHPIPANSPYEPGTGGGQVTCSGDRPKPFFPAAGLRLAAQGRATPRCLARCRRRPRRGW